MVEEQYKPDRTILRLSFTSISMASNQKPAIETPKLAIDGEKVPFESIKLAMQNLNYSEPTRKNIALSTNKVLADKSSMNNLPQVVQT